MGEARQGSEASSCQAHLATFDHGRVQLDLPVDWAEGTRLDVRVMESPTQGPDLVGKPAVIAGFGLAGRWAADLFERCGVAYLVVERNARTVVRQSRLGKNVILGDVCDEQTLVCAGIERAGILALTIPDEQAVLRATALARQLNPELYIIARTIYTSSGLQAGELGANDVVKAEQAVAREFHEKLARRLAASRGQSVASRG